MLRVVLANRQPLLARAAAPMAMRSMSETAQAAFKDIFKKYYTENYRNTLFSRMKKDVIKVTDANQDGIISEEELRALLANIGANMSDDDILALMALGSEDGKGIPNKTFLKLLG
mmetsp:Transcript_11355/g.34402  ORF Transcript_11355/g.34402 Transcript_11355/m.34402 type:complete len:115 (-) Transcript_11355:285-629(-)